MALPASRVKVPTKTNMAPKKKEESKRLEIFVEMVFPKKSNSTAKGL
jgi:hypothetical protein